MEGHEIIKAQIEIYEEFLARHHNDYTVFGNFAEGLGGEVAVGVSHPQMLPSPTCFKMAPNMWDVRCPACLARVQVLASEYIK